MKQPLPNRPERMTMSPIATPETSREQLDKPSPRKQNLSRKQKAGVAFGAISIAATSFVLGQNANKDVPTPGLSAKEAKAIAIETAIDVTEVKENSEDWAVMVAESLNNRTPMGMDILHGTIDVKDVNGDFNPLHENAILIHTLDPEAKIDAKGNYLKGAFLGGTYSNSEGKVVIIAFPFDAEDMRFTPYNRDEPVINATVYATQYKVRDEASATSLIAFDPNGQKQLTNPNGSVISPGLMIGGGKGGVPSILDN